MFSQLVSILKSKKIEKVLILTHQSADPDGLGSCLALKEGLSQIGISSKVGVPQSIGKFCKTTFGDWISQVEINPEIEDYDLVFVLDTSSSPQLNPLEIKGKIVLIDHHLPGDLEKKAEFKFIRKNAKSTSQLIYCLLEELNVEINEEMAELLLIGLIYDSRHLKLAEKKEFEVLIKLLQKSRLSYGEILEKMHSPPELSERIARLKASRRSELYKINGYVVLFSKISSFEGSSANSLVKMGADIAIVGCIRKNEIRISGRGRRNILEHVDLAEDVFKKLEDIIQGQAGGHNLAASGNGKNTESWDKVKNKILEILKKKLGGKVKKL